MPRTCCAPSLYAAHCFALCVSVCVCVLGGGRRELLGTHMRTHARLLSGSLCVFWRLRSGMCPESLRLRRTSNSKVHQLGKKKGHRRSNSKIINSHFFFPRLEYIFANKEGITDRLDFSLFFSLLMSVESYTFEMPLRRVNLIPLVSSPLSRHQHACHQNPRQGGPAGPA